MIFKQNTFSIKKYCQIDQYTRYFKIKSFHKIDINYFLTYERLRLMTLIVGQKFHFCLSIYNSLVHIIRITVSSVLYFDNMQPL